MANIYRSKLQDFFSDPISNERKIMQALWIGQKQRWLDNEAIKIISSARLDVSPALKAQQVTAIDSQIDSRTKEFWLKLNWDKYQSAHPVPVSALAPISLRPVDRAEDGSFTVTHSADALYPTITTDGSTEASDGETDDEFEIVEGPSACADDMLATRGSREIALAPLPGRPHADPNHVINSLKREYESELKTYNSWSKSWITSKKTTDAQYKKAQEALIEYVSALISCAREASKHDSGKHVAFLHASTLATFQCPEGFTLPVQYRREEFTDWLATYQAEKMQYLNDQVDAFKVSALAFARLPETDRTSAQKQELTTQLASLTVALESELKEFINNDCLQSATDIYRLLLSIRKPVGIVVPESLNRVSLLNRLAEINPDAAKIAVCEEIRKTIPYMFVTESTSFYGQIDLAKKLFGSEENLPAELDFYQALASEAPGVKIPRTSDIDVSIMHLETARKKAPNNLLFSVYEFSLLSNLGYGKCEKTGKRYSEMQEAVSNSTRRHDEQEWTRLSQWYDNRNLIRYYRDDTQTDVRKNFLAALNS